MKKKVRLLNYHDRYDAISENSDVSTGGIVSWKYMKKYSQDWMN